jgi:hypothetical protein
MDEHHSFEARRFLQAYTLQKKGSWRWSVPLVHILTETCPITGEMLSPYRKHFLPAIYLIPTIYYLVEFSIFFIFPWMPISNSKERNVVLRILN